MKTVTSRYIKSSRSGMGWKDIALAARETEPRTLEIYRPEPVRWEEQNKNTSHAIFELESGFYTEMGTPNITAYNVDLSKYDVIKGKTYDIKEYIKAEGFKWDGTHKCWVRKQAIAK